MTSAARPQCHAEWVADAKSPNPRTSRFRTSGIEKRVARNPIASGGIDPEDFTVETIEKLRAICPDIFLGLNNTVGEGLRRIATGGHATCIDGVRSRAVSISNEQCPIFAEYQTAGSMSIRTQWSAGLFGRSN